jgi:hypothetical protein
MFTLTTSVPTAGVVAMFESLDGIARIMWCVNVVSLIT